jgi:hypothetical protein
VKRIAGVNPETGIDFVLLLNAAAKEGVRGHRNRTVRIYQDLRFEIALNQNTRVSSSPTHASPDSQT